MSEQSATTNDRPSNRDRVRARLSSFGRSREQRMLGPAEMMGLAGAALILLLVVVSYFYFLLPANSRLTARQSERTLLQAQIKSLQDVVREGQSTEATVQQITESLEDFESRQLVNADRGRMGLYDSLNLLMRNNGLRNTSGPTYAPLEPAGAKTNTGSNTKTGNTKWQSVYPGIAISLTVEGQYPNLRKFLQELERDKQFVIINSVELERSTDTNTLVGAEGKPAGATAVSLRLEMATYFQRGSGSTESTDFSAPAR
jgi:Tfp pilus assembly protein PilO